jgi:hypothetical protein
MCPGPADRAMMPLLVTWPIRNRRPRFFGPDHQTGRGFPDLGDLRAEEISAEKMV